MLFAFPLIQIGLNIQIKHLFPWITVNRADSRRVIIRLWLRSTSNASTRHQLVARSPLTTSFSLEPGQNVNGFTCQHHKSGEVLSLIRSIRSSTCKPYKVPPASLPNAQHAVILPVQPFPLPQTYFRLFNLPVWITIKEFAALLEWLGWL